MFFTRPGNSKTLRALVKDSPLIADAVQRHPDRNFETGSTAAEWFARRIKYQRINNRKVSEKTKTTQKNSSRLVVQKSRRIVHVADVMKSRVPRHGRRAGVRNIRPQWRNGRSLDGRLLLELRMALSSSFCCSVCCNSRLDAAWVSKSGSSLGVFFVF